MAFPWDHENRLTAVETDTDVTEEAYRWRRELVYDGLGRLRIRKDYDWLSSSGWSGWYPIRTTYYIYDGWLLVQERSTYPTATYVWGPDLSGTVGGAGGISGLLARSTGYDRSTGTWSTHRYYHCDAMGNIMAMIDADGNVKAAYRYDPYGRLRSWTGPEADDNPFRFSTKLWLDFGPDYYGNAGEFNIDHGLYYYGYRYYSPTLQRWLSRDPLGEQKGANLYKTMGNQPINAVDDYGLDYWIVHTKGCCGVSHLVIIGEDGSSGAFEFSVLNPDGEWVRTTVQIPPKYYIIEFLPHDHGLGLFGIYKGHYEFGGPYSSRPVEYDWEHAIRIPTVPAEDRFLYKCARNLNKKKKTYFLLFQDCRHVRYIWKDTLESVRPPLTPLNVIHNKPVLYPRITIKLNEGK